MYVHLHYYKSRTKQMAILQIIFFFGSTHFVLSEDNRDIYFRVILAALHFNVNSCRTQACDKEGNQRWRLSYPKAKKGKPTPKPIPTPVNFGQFWH